MTIAPDELAFAPAHRQAELLRAGEVSARELCDVHLERIARLDPRLNAFRVVLAGAARSAADAAQARIDAGDGGPLTGVPVAVKDNVDVAGEVTTHGTAAHGGPATADSELVRRIREAGMVILGKTHLPELAAHPFTESETHGPTRNPWDRERTPGGSSGGSAAAVAAGLAAIGHASDGGGSIRVPAAYCGLFGLKVQRDRVSLAPDREHWFGLSVAHCVTRDVLDSALFLDAVADDPHPSYADAARREPGSLRVAWTTRPAQPGLVAADVRAAVRETVDLLRSLGHGVARRTPRWGFTPSGFVPRFLRGLREDAERLPHPERLEARTRAMARMGRGVGDGLLERSRRAGERAAERLSATFDEADVLLTPVVPYAAEPVGKWAGKGVVRTINRSAFGVVFTAPWNVAGNPAAAVPAGWDDAGMPRSVLLVGRTGDEETLLSLAAQLERARPWATRRPPL
jgi:amidase